MAKPLLVIANHQSGSFTTNVDTVKASLDKYGIKYDLKIVQTLPGAIKAARAASANQYDAVAVFGGDGTVLNVIKQLVDRHLPVLVLPGGSANSLAVTIEPVLTIDDILKLYANGSYVIRHMQLGERDGEPLVLDAHYGILAQSMVETPRDLKHLVGRWAYYITTIKNLMRSQPDNYHLEVDGKTVKTPAYACFIVNHGTLKLLGQPIAPSYRPGSLRLAIIRPVSAWQVTLWLLSKLILRRNRQSVIISRRAETIKVIKAPSSFYCDDHDYKPQLPAEFTVSNRTATVMVPSYNLNAWRNRLRVWRTLYYRGIDYTARKLFGAPTVRYSRIDKHIYLGGQYTTRVAGWFRRRHITGVVSMREFVPKKLVGVDIVHLPTRDHHAPKLEDMEQGAKFIAAKVAAGESVYIHCRQGEGRGPTMAAAYLIWTGMRPVDALAQLQLVRPHARPTKSQITALEDFARLHYSDLTARE